jgi:hypothetical protein
MRQHPGGFMRGRPSRDATTSTAPNQQINNSTNQQIGPSHAVPYVTNAAALTPFQLAHAFF